MAHRKKKENKRFWRKNFLSQLKLKERKGTRTWSFSYESYAIRICLYCFNPTMYILWHKKRLNFTYYDVKTHSFLFKSPISSKILVSKKNADTFLYKRVCRVRTVKNWLKPSFPLYFFTLQTCYILLKIDSEKKRP